MNLKYGTQSLPSDVPNYSEMSERGMSENIKVICLLERFLCSREFLKELKRETVFGHLRVKECPKLNHFCIIVQKKIVGGGKDSHQLQHSILKFRRITKTHSFQ